MKRGIFATAYTYLTEHSIPADILDTYLQPEPRPTAMPLLYRQFLEHARNRNMMPKVVWEVEQLEQALHGFNIDYVCSTYVPTKTGTLVIYGELNRQHLPKNKTDKNTLKKTILPLDDRLCGIPEPVQLAARFL